MEIRIRRVYEAQCVFREQRGRYASSAESLGLAHLALPGWSWPPRLAVTAGMYEAVLERDGGHSLHLSHDGRIWAAER